VGRITKPTFELAIGVRHGLDLRQIAASGLQDLMGAHLPLLDALE
jgi:hypothetical protein